MSAMDLKAVMAVAVALACLVLLLRLVLGARRRARFDAAFKAMGRQLRRRALLLWHWRSSRQAAAKATQDAIERARRIRGTQEGNVYTPDAFKDPRKPH